MPVWLGNRKESSIELSCKRFIKGKGFLLKIQGAKGWPDRILVLPGGLACWVEFKTQSGELQPLQVWVHNELAKLGHKVWVVRDLHEFKRLVIHAMDSVQVSS